MKSCEYCFEKSWILEFLVVCPEMSCSVVETSPVLFKFCSLPLFFLRGGIFPCFQFFKEVLMVLIFIGYLGKQRMLSNRSLRQQIYCKLLMVQIHPLWRSSCSSWRKHVLKHLTNDHLKTSRKIHLPIISIHELLLSMVLYLFPSMTHTMEKTRSSLHTVAVCSSQRYQ